MKTKNRQELTITIPWIMEFASQIFDYNAKVASKINLETKDFKLKNPFNNFKFDFSKIKNVRALATKRNIVIAVAAVFVLLVSFGVIRARSGAGVPLVSGVSQSNFSPNASVAINRKFEIPIRSSDGKETGNKLAISLTTLDRSRRILIQGQPATARDTKTFVIINLEVENSTKDQLTVRPVDFVRLVDNEGRNFAPDVHNNEVIVEAISIKKTRVGFVVDENQNNFKFLIGEVNGNKETVEVAI